MKATKESEEKFRRIFDDSPIGIELYDRKGNLLEINKASLKIFGISDIKNVPNYNFFEDPNTPENIKEDLEFGKISRFEKIYDFAPIKKSNLYETSKSGKIFHDVLVSPLFLKGDKEFSHLLVQVQDITLKKLAEQKIKESEENYRNLINNLSDAIVKIDLNGTLTYASPEMYNMFGFKETELIGFNNLTLIHPDDLPNLIKIMKEAVKSNKKLYFEFRVKHKNGHYVPVAARGSAIKEEGKIRLIGVLTDITESKNAEQKLRESEIKHRLAYNRADFYKDLFAHDMNNILHNILSSIDLYSLCQKYPEKLDKGEELLDLIKTQAKRGAKLISNIQKLSLLEQTELQTEKVDICDHLKNAIKFVKESFQDRNLNILIEAKNENFHVRANELLLDVFENILINSVKYNNNNSVLINNIISKEIKDEKKYIKLQFLDNGIGIPDSRKETIFDRSYKKDRTLKGMGIGLSLVRSIIYSYNGHITIEDKEQGDYSKGSNFIIYIPEME